MKRDKAKPPVAQARNGYANNRKDEDEGYRARRNERSERLVYVTTSWRNTE